MDINAFRQQYPEYNDLEDNALADTLYNKLYSDIPREQFEQTFRPGLNASGQQQQQPIPLIPGNINLHNRPIVKNSDGSFSTVRSLGISDDQGRNIVIPTISDDGRIMSNEEAIQQYKQSGRHLGIFKDQQSADLFAQNLHKEQEREYSQAAMQPTTESTLAYVAGRVASGALEIPSAVEQTVGSYVQPQVKYQQQKEVPEGMPEGQWRALQATGGVAPAGIGIAPTTQAYEVEKTPEELEAEQKKFQRLQQALPVKPELKDSFWLSRVPEGVGTGLGFMAVAGLGEVAGLGAIAPTAILGGLLGGHGVAEEMRQAGEEPNPWAVGLGAVSSAVTSSLPYGMLFGKTGAASSQVVQDMLKKVPFGGLLQRLNAASGDRLVEALGRGGVGALSMATMNALQTPVGNMIARKWYDENRGVLDNVLPAIGEGLVVGGTIGVGHGLLGGRVNRTLRDTRIGDGDFGPGDTEAAAALDRVQPGEMGGPTAEDYARYDRQLAVEQASREGAASEALGEQERNAAWEAQVGTEVSGGEIKGPRLDYQPSMETPPVPKNRPIIPSVGIEEPPKPKGPVVPERPWHPVQEALKMSFMDRTIAEGTADEFTKLYGKKFYVWSTPEGLKLRLGPQPEAFGYELKGDFYEDKTELGKEYEDWLDKLPKERLESKKRLGEANRELNAQMYRYQQEGGLAAREPVMVAQRKLAEQRAVAAKQVEDIRSVLDEGIVKTAQVEQADPESGGIVKEVAKEAEEKPVVQPKAETNLDRIKAAARRLGAKRRLEQLEREEQAKEKRLRKQGITTLDKMFEEGDEGWIESKAPEGVDSIFSIPELDGFDELPRGGKGGGGKLYSFGPEMFGELFKDWEKLPEGNILQQLGRKYTNSWMSPFFGRRFNEKLAVPYTTSQKYREDSTRFISRAMDRVAGEQNLSVEQRQDVGNILKELDEKGQLKAVPAKQVMFENGVAKLNPEYERQLRNWLGSKNVDPATADFIVAYRTTLDQVFTDVYNHLSKRPDVDRNYLEKLRDNVGFQPNYFPHMWYGTHYIEGRDASGKALIRVPMDVDWLQRMGGRAKVGKIREALLNDPAMKKLGIVEATDVQKADELERYWMNSPVPLDVIMKVLDNATGHLKEKYGDMTVQFQKDLPKEVMTTLKSRGFGNFAERKGMLGYEQSNYMKVFYDYVSGAYRNLARIDKARALSEYLGSEKMGKEDYEVVKKFIEDSMSPRSEMENLVNKLQTFVFMKNFTLRARPAILHASNIGVTAMPIHSMYTDGVTKTFLKVSADLAHQFQKEFPLYREIDRIKGMPNAKDDVISSVELRALKELRESGVTSTQMTNALRGKIRDVEGFNARLAQKAGFMLGSAEAYARNVSALAALRAVQEGKVTSEKFLKKYGWEKGQKVDLTKEGNYLKALDFAKELVYEAHREYASYNRPALVRKNALGSAFFTFKAFHQHLFDMWTNMALHEGWRGKRALTASLLGHGAMVGLVPGIPLAALMMKFWEKQIGEDPEAALREQLPENEMLRDLVFGGVPAVGNIYLGSDYSTIPTSIGELLGAPAQVFTDTIEAYNAWSRGNPKRAVEYMVPLMIVRNALSAMREANEGQRTIGGEPINLAGEVGPRIPTASETAIKAVGLKSMTAEKLGKRNEALHSEMQFKRDAQMKLADRYTNAINAGDYAKAQGVMDEVIAWNMKVLAREQPEMVITASGLSQALRNRLGGRTQSKRILGRAMELDQIYGLK